MNKIFPKKFHDAKEIISFKTKNSKINKFTSIG